MKIKDQISSIHSNKKNYFEIEAYSSSFLKALEKNPELKLNEKIKFNTSKAQLFGHILHRSILEKNKFELNKRMYLNLVSPSDQKIFYEVRKNLDKNETIQKLINSTIENEKEIYFDLQIENEKTNEKKEVKAKAKLDAIFKNGVIDYKKTSYLNFYKREIKKYRYDLQMSFYLQALRSQKGFESADKAVLIFLETVHPFSNHVVILSKEILENAKHSTDPFFKGWMTLIKEKEFENKKRFESDYTILDQL